MKKNEEKKMQNVYICKISDKNLLNVFECENNLIEPCKSIILQSGAKNPHTSSKLK